MIGIEDLEKMTTLEITKKLVSLFKEYDSLRDDELNMLDENPHRDMWDKGTEDTYNTLVKDSIDFIKKNSHPSVGRTPFLIKDF